MGKKNWKIGKKLNERRRLPKNIGKKRTLQINKNGIMNL